MLTKSKAKHRESYFHSIEYKTFNKENKKHKSSSKHTNLSDEVKYNLRVQHFNEHKENFVRRRIPEIKL